MNEVGNKVVHAPSDHGIHIISAADTTISNANTFIDIEDNDGYTSYLDISDNDDHESIQDKIKSLYDFAS